MKNIQEINRTLKIELTNWFPKQCNNNFDDYYLWYHPTTNETDGSIIIAKERPRHGNTEMHYDLVMPERINKGASIEENYNRIVLSGVLAKLPILER